MEKKIEIKEGPSLTPTGFGLGYRHLIVLLMFLCLVILYGLRVNMSVAIVAMTDVNSTVGFPTYNWTRKEQNLIQSSFYWGYIVTQIPAAFIGQRLGPHYPLGIAALLGCTVMTLTSLVAPFGPVAMEGLRIMQGFAHGFLFPSLHNLCSKWIPKNERGRLVTFIYAGAQLGTVVSLSISGVIAENKHLGWPAIFYIGGATGITWAIIWIFFGSNRPSEYKYISKEELKYIDASMGDNELSKEKLPIPWLAIFTSKHMWALIIVHAANTWCALTLLTEMPTYMKDILKYDIKKSGWSSSLPYLTMWLLSFIFGPSSDFVINRKLISVTASRKLFNTIAMWIPSVALIILGYTSNPLLALSLLIVAVGLNSAIHVGFGVNHMDLAPNFAGIMMGITNCIATVMSIVAPIVVGFIVNGQNPTIGQWRTVFFIAAAINFFGNLIFIIFGTAKLQPWNDPLPTGDTVTQKQSAEKLEHENSKV